MYSSASESASKVLFKSATFAKIQLNDLTTFSGDIHHIKTFMTSQGSVGSFELVDVIKILEELNKHAVVILMSTLQIPSEQNLGFVMPEGMDLLGWMGVVNAVDHVLGCDSVAQHFANALGTSATVAIGATYPGNISYPEKDGFKIFDIGGDDRVYSPIRVQWEPAVELNNEGLMLLNDDQRNAIIENVLEEIK